MRKIFDILRYYNYRSKFFIAAIALRILIMLLDILFPLLTGWAIDIIFRHDLSRVPAMLRYLHSRVELSRLVLYLVGAMLLIAALQALSMVYQNRFRNIFSQQGTLRMRNKLFNKLQQLPVAWFVQVESGDIIQRCTSDVDTIHRFINNQFFEVIVPSLNIIVSLVIIFSYDFYLAISSILFSPLIIFLCWRYGKNRIKLFRLWDESEGKLSNILQEYLSGIRVVTALGQGEREHHKFSEQNKKLSDYGFFVFHKMASFWGLSDFLTYSQQILILLVGTLSVLHGRLSLGVMLAFLIYSERNIFMIRNVSRTIGDAGKVIISYDRLQQIFQSPSEPDESHLQSIGLCGDIEFKNVTFCYPGAHLPVLKNINLKVNKGETLGILGPTGSGKTTMLLLLHKLFYPTSGEIFFDGVPMSKINKRCLREQIGLNLQEPYIFSRNIKDNIRITNPESSDDTVQEYARIAQIKSDIEGFKAGYETIVGERGVTLSGGQKQRLAIARTLLRDCPINVFDDSLSALDTSTDKALRYELASQNRQKTTIIVSHRISTLLDCNRVAVIENGEIVQLATPKQLLVEEGLFSRIYHLQQSE